MHPKPDEEQSVRASPTHEPATNGEPERVVPVDTNLIQLDTYVLSLIEIFGVFSSHKWIHRNQTYCKRLFWTHRNYFLNVDICVPKEKYDFGNARSMHWIC